MDQIKYIKTFNDVIQNILGRKFNIENILYPLDLGHIITKKCNFRCSMCNIWKDKSSDDLSLEEIDRFAKSEYLKKVFVIGLSGGEPFIRPDLVDIVQIYKKRLKKLKQVTLSTNGSLTGKIKSDVSSILESGLETDVTISIDGIGNVHDKIRGFSGSYERIVETVHMLRNLQRKYNGLDIGLRFTILPNNYREMSKVYRLANKMKINFTAKPAVVGGYFKNIGGRYEFNDIQKKKIISDFKFIIKEEKKRSNKIGDIFFEIKRLAFIEFLKYSIDYIINPSKQLFPCYACFSLAWIENNGDVRSCPILYKKMGNIRKNSFDEIWQSEEMHNIRQFIKKGKCSCFTNCSQVPSLVINNFPRLLVEELKNKIKIYSRNKNM